MAAKYKVNVWKTEVYHTTIEVIAPNRHKAAQIAQEEAAVHATLTWEFVDSDIETDTPVSGEYFE